MRTARRLRRSAASRSGSSRSAEAMDVQDRISPFDALIRTEWLDDDPDHARARVAVRDELLQPVGLLHGGVMSTVVESVCSRATAIANAADRMLAMGQSIDVNFLRPVTEGAIEVHAVA